MVESRDPRQRMHSGWADNEKQRGSPTGGGEPLPWSGKVVEESGRKERGQTWESASEPPSTPYSILHLVFPKSV